MIKAQLFTDSLPYCGKNCKTIWVYVPSHTEGETMPVIYMTDGQNLFDEKMSYCGSWDVIKAVENEQKQGRKSAVIVGVDNGSINRDSELTPKSIGTVLHTDLLDKSFSPQGEEFDRFLINTVMPYVESNYPVKTDRKFTAVCGSSSGGLQAFFEGMEHSDKFAFVGALSPAFLLYSKEDWQKYLLAKITDNMPYLYIYTGNGDELEQTIFESVEMMYDLLPECGYPYHMMNEVILFENEHNEKAWKEIFKDFLHTFLTRVETFDI